MATIEAKLEERRKKLEEARSALQPEDLLEIEKREQLAQLETEIEEELQKARDLDLDRRFDAATEALGGSASIRAVSIKGFPDSFIVQKDCAAHNRWKEALYRAANGKGDKEKAGRDYAAAVVYDWNGTVNNGDDPALTLRLLKYLTENPGITTPLVDTAAELVGVFARERKS